MHSYQSFLKQEKRPQKAGPSPLSATQTTAEAFRLLAVQGMQMWQANLLGTLTTSDPEFVHQYRVSLRRLNSLIKVFKPTLPDCFQREWMKKLKELAQVTGEVRDLEVMQSCILQPILQRGDEEMQAQISGVLAACDKARLAATAEVYKLGVGVPVLLFGRDIQELTAEDFPKNLQRFGERRLSAMHGTALKRLSKTLKSPTPENAHRFRIALKHLRYSCEFFAPLFDSEEMAEYAKSIAALQDELGFINDFHVSLCTLKLWADRGNISLAARESVAAWHRAHADAVLESALHAGESVLNRCLPWCTECERRGLSSIPRRLKHEVLLEIQ